jgi:hypothetical protein
VHAACSGPRPDPTRLSSSNTARATEYEPQSHLYSICTCTIQYSTVQDHCHILVSSPLQTDAVVGEAQTTSPREFEACKASHRMRLSPQAANHPASPRLGFLVSQKKRIRRYRYRMGPATTAESVAPPPLTLLSRGMQ